MNAVVKADERWSAFLAEVSSGVPVPDAMLSCRIRRSEIEAAVLQPLEAQRWAAAQAAALRATWSVFDLQQAFTRVAGGMSVDDAVTEVKGAFDPTLFLLIAQDETVGAMYASAMEAWALRQHGEITRISDDSSNDVLQTPKGPLPNNAAVGRSKLMTDTRFRLMGAWNERFSEKRGTQVNVQVNNHSERLEAGRERAKLRGAQPADGTKKQLREVVDATFSSERIVPGRDEVAKQLDTDTSWMDDKPTDSVWRED
jgi:hypothetical protein